MGEIMRLNRGAGLAQALRPAGLFFVAAFLLSFAVQRTHAAEVERELEGIRKKIERERQGITKVQKKEGSILQGLEKIEAELDRKNHQLKKVNAKLESVLAELQKKEEAVARLSSSLKSRRDLLRKRARALYKWRRGGSPLVLLSGGASAVEIMQRKRYLELMLAYDRQLVDHLVDEAARQEAVKRELAQKREEAAAEKKSLVGVQESIRLEREKKKEVLASLRREKEARSRALKELEQAAQRLQRMIDDISRRSVVESKGLGPGRGFEAMRGKLDFPVRGEVTGGFGKTRHPEFSAELFRKGIDIEAPLGEEIRAVEAGRVVFADRFSGYGRMMIVDHGQRYYTIYAHLSELLKKTGEVVRRGEPIALVGDSDSLAGARLYFEIRKDGKPLNPLPWFRKR